MAEGTPAELAWEPVGQAIAEGAPAGKPVVPGGRPPGGTCRAGRGYLFGRTGLPPGSTWGGGMRSLRICSARIAA